jgi:hypothetical protein
MCHCASTAFLAGQNACPYGHYWQNLWMVKVEFEAWKIVMGKRPRKET